MCKNHKEHTSRRPSRKGVSRRDVIRYGVGSALGYMALGPMGRGVMQQATGAPIASHKRCVVMYCYGGYDGLNMVVPHSSTQYNARRPTIAVPQASTIGFGKTGYGINDNLPLMAAAYNAGDGAIFQKVGYPSRNLSHFTSQDIYSKGVRGNFDTLPISESGWVARFVDNYTTDSLGAVSVGVGRPMDFEGGNISPLMVNSLSSFRFSSDSDFPANQPNRVAALQSVLNSYNGSSLDADAEAALQQGLDLTAAAQTAVADYVPKTGTQYGTGTPARYMEDIARMIQAGFDTKLFFTGFGGWDNHSDEISGMSNRQQRLDHAIGMFKEHCEQMNVWDDMLVIVVSEFGRRIFENGSNGTDHGHGNCFF
ncbi:MAG: DUF1501 domain-containing protein, partial [bacterium]|nr:DUF1501 domain-containing protein [bacterium]